MSGLKWETLEQLEVYKSYSESDMSDLERRIMEHQAVIGELQGKRNNQGIRLSWINHYISKKSPVKMTLAEIEQQLGHKVTIEVST